MTTYKLHKESGATELIQAKNFTHAERIAYGRRGALKDWVIGIAIHEEITDAEKTRRLTLAAQLFKK